MIRLFTALLIPDEIKQTILAASHSLVDNFEQYRWATPDKIHLTLKFIGEVEEELTEPIQQELSFTEDFKYFNCSITKFGFFFRKSEPKILWVGLKISERIYKMVEELNYRLTILSIPIENRRLKPHVTVLRLKQHPGDEFIKKFEEYSFKEIKFKLKTLALVKSELFRAGALYTDIKKYNLK